MVTYACDKHAIGIILSIHGTEVTVMWSRAPGWKPGVKVQDLTSVQPMSMPSGLLFYLDYTYGSGSKEET